MRTAVNPHAAAKFHRLHHVDGLRGAVGEVADAERLPPPDTTTEVAGIALPRLAVAPGIDSILLIHAALRTHDSGR